MYLEKSHIPLDIWKAGDSTSNVMESAHMDVDLETRAVHSSWWGRAFDAMKMAIFSAVGDRSKPMFRRLLKRLGNRQSYKSGHLSEVSDPNVCSGHRIGR